VLKAYGRKRPSEAQVQRLWRSNGVNVVAVLEHGDDPATWLLMPPLRIEAVSDLHQGHRLDLVTRELAELMTPAHNLGAAALKTGELGANLQRLDEAMTLHLAAVLIPLARHGYPVRQDWRELIRALSASGRPAVLHGDLGGGNVVRNTDDRTLQILDTCGYIGPAEFDAARWAARHGGATRAEDALAAWLDTEPGLDYDLANALLGLELLMEAGVREIVKEERGEPWDVPDRITLDLVRASHRLSPR
jgi:hypothetical protein